MCMTKKGVMVFLFFFKQTNIKKKTSLFQLLPTFSCGALMHDQRTQLVIAFIETLCERYWYKLTLDALECFCDKRHHGLKETQCPSIVGV